MITKTTQIQTDDITDELSRLFDYEFSGTSTTIVPEFEVPDDYQIGLIVGGSGSGKSTLLSSMGLKQNEFNAHHQWNPSQCIASHFQNAEQARVRLNASGFNSVHNWMQPYHTLSTGQKFRADISRRLNDNTSFDEFTSVVDRNVAKSASYAVQRYIRKYHLNNVVFASCHRDIIEWLDPDWVYDTDSQVLTRRSERHRPTIEIELRPTHSSTWGSYSKHHYLTDKLNKSARCWEAVWMLPSGEEVKVGFMSILRFPHPQIKFGWRGHRAVVLPEFQGLGIGNRIIEAVGEMILSDDGRYFLKAAHPTVVDYWDSNPRYRPTAHNKQARPEYKTGIDRRRKDDKDPSHGSEEHLIKHADRVCGSFEYMSLEWLKDKEK